MELDNRHERVIFLATEINRLRLELSQLEKELNESLLQSSRIKGKYISGSIPDRLLTIMESQPKRVFTIIDFTNEKISKQNISTALFRLKKNDHIKKVKCGHYQAKNSF